MVADLKWREGCGWKRMKSMRFRGEMLLKVNGRASCGDAGGGVASMKP